MSGAPMNDYRLLSDGVTRVLASIPVEGVWLRRDGDHVVVLIERGDKWIECIRENIDSPFSHIIEPEGIRACFATPRGLP